MRNREAINLIVLPLLIMFIKNCVYFCNKTLLSIGVWQNLKKIK